MIFKDCSFLPTTQQSFPFETLMNHRDILWGKIEWILVHEYLMLFNFTPAKFSKYCKFSYAMVLKIKSSKCNLQYEWDKFLNLVGVKLGYHEIWGSTAGATAGNWLFSGDFFEFADRYSWIFLYRYLNPSNTSPLLHGGIHCTSLDSIQTVN